ncbi:Aste57867_16293 [Aphanomyces stellatus]|uniref:DNA topoisomerase (ATP-hydrolyzing) n=1 Tax=Aphanomyces stellatus TaxID=120398 RepID=A0A485L555_9STRA|nr:hypothetical protein As57867_016236 [Aphanomyces stellatus]VFT93069.1 Aste57867_16293 [Aphanomyces stellatus]
MRRSSNAMVFDGETQSLYHSGEKKTIRLNGQGAKKYTGMWLVLQTVYNLLKEDKTITQRELYYLHTFFETQKDADECILDVGGFLGVPRECLNIVGGVKGCFTGRISIAENGLWIDCAKDGPTGRPITRETLRLQPEQITSDANFILVIEKDGIFNRLSEDCFFDTMPCILVTGKGFPDLATRCFVRKLSDCLGIPVLGLCDCNPFGLSILLTYKLGSARMPLDAMHYTVDIRWIGLRPSHVPQLDLPPVVKKKFSKHDKHRIQSLLQHPYIQMQPQYQEEIACWVHDPFKIELEALHTKGFGYLGEFLLDKVLHGDYI